MARMPITLDGAATSAVPGTPSLSSVRGRIAHEDIGVDAVSRLNGIEVDARGPFILTRDLVVAGNEIVAVPGRKRLAGEIDEVGSARQSLPGGGRSAHDRLVGAERGVKLFAGKTPPHERCGR